MQLAVHFLPELVDPHDLASSHVVVIDVLRATTTMVHALAAGATAVLPCCSIEEARECHQRQDNVVLGGERGGERIEGFDFGNSPDEYTAESVFGKKVAFTTTNGTLALRHAEAAKRVLVGAFVNFSAVCGELVECARIDLLCAGTNRQITREDVLFAGAVVNELTRDRSGELNDQAELARDAWRAATTELVTSSLLPSALRCSLGGRNLIEIGHEADIDLAAQLDRFDFVPEFRDGLVRKW